MQEHDLAILGAGVAGLTAATMAARHGLKTVVIDRMGVGGQIMTVAHIQNFPGFPQGIAGHELGPLLQEQAETAGAEFTLDTVEAIEVEGDYRILRCSDEDIRARAVIIAAGSAKRTLGIPGEEKFAGRGVSHCASCDGPLYKEQVVCVVGGGDAALDESLVLADFASRVIVVHRGPRLDAQHCLVKRAAAATNIELVLESTVSEILGQETVEAVRIRGVKPGDTATRDVSGIFVYVGLEPNTAFLRNLVALNPTGHIQTDSLMRTSLEGVFAAGDIRADSVAYLASSSGDGATAAITAFRYLRSRC
jgi:thioredoxin reductase (NADPH)